MFHALSHRSMLIYFISASIVYPDPDMSGGRRLHDGHGRRDTAIWHEIRHLSVMDEVSCTKALHSKAVCTDSQPEQSFAIQQNTTDRVAIQRPSHLWQPFIVELCPTRIDHIDAASNHPHPHDALTVAQQGSHFAPGD